jgi:GNAT superfamily N-acetyltransferase
MSPENYTPPASLGKNWRGQISLRSMTLADIPFGLGLSEAEGWNQTEEDWEILLAHSSSGSLVASYNGVDAGTVTVVSYRDAVSNQDRLHWIGMLLVRDEYRKRGIGRALLEACLESITGAGAICLDATPAGLRLYEALGFQAVYPLARWLRQPGKVDAACASTVYPLTGELLPEVIVYDLPVFGAERAGIFNSLLRRASQFAIHSRTSGTITAFCLGRPGSRFAQIGPIAADRLEAACDLLLAVLCQNPNQELIIDAPYHHHGWNEFLSDMGFKEQRPFTRMCLGNWQLPEQHAKQLAIAGPEIG